MQLQPALAERLLVYQSGVVPQEVSEPSSSSSSVPLVDGDSLAGVCIPLCLPTGLSTSLKTFLDVFFLIKWTFLVVLAEASRLNSQPTWLKAKTL